MRGKAHVIAQRVADIDAPDTAAVIEHHHTRMHGLAASHLAVFKFRSYLKVQRYAERNAEKLKAKAKSEKERGFNTHTLE